MVSIITNCYNGEKYLEETIQSVLAQTYTDWEYLLFDNNSTDRSAEIFKSHNDPRFKYFKNDTTVPLGHGRYLAEKLVQGDYVCFIDSDDLWLPTNLEKQVAIMEKDPEVGLVYSDFVYFGVNNTPRKTGKPGYQVTSEMLVTYDPGLSSTMFRKSVLKEYGIEINKNYDIIADFDLFIRISRVAKCYHIKENLVKYRTHASNLSSTSTKEPNEIKDVYEQFMKVFTDEEKRECKKGLVKLQDKYWTCTFNVCMRNHDYKGILECIVKAKIFRTKLYYIKRIILQKLKK